MRDCMVPRVIRGRNGPQTAAHSLPIGKVIFLQTISVSRQAAGPAVEVVLDHR
jgi:hypothetical protein